MFIWRVINRIIHLEGNKHNSHIPLTERSLLLSFLSVVTTYILNQGNVNAVVKHALFQILLLKTHHHVRRISLCSVALFGKQIFNHYTTSASWIKYNLSAHFFFPESFRSQLFFPSFPLPVCFLISPPYFSMFSFVI
jgi:hypothetical protein